MVKLNRMGRALLVAAMLAGGAAPLAAQPAARVTETGVASPASMVFIGNSFFYYNNGITNHVSEFLRANAPSQRLRATLIGIGGSGLDWHDVESYFRPNAVARYTIDRNNVLSLNHDARLFDVAVMMDCSQCPVHPDLNGAFAEYARRHAETVRRHGAQPVFFMSWAYLDKPDMTVQLAEAYTRIGNENGAMVIPAGLAFARVVAERPDIGLYVADKRHPSLAGTYLAAAVTYAALFNQSPVGSSYTAGLDPAVARILQDAAASTVREYLRR
ncbi:hypothetical protein [Roseomonas populi]|uniref:SGNH/GDSL hydrolase family protein n=1 Tax=Roseomonas populi TaxID=3121582 RepID=A0ABT1WZ55_9PROT|nr:hypothetical protein [Roseomonas pecuniae]MCR0981104.1 hypothetical protein [Roseomonas pecuniae]